MSTATTTATETLMVEAVTDLKWGVATLEPHGVIAAFYGYALAMEFFKQVQSNVGETIDVFILKFDERRVYGRVKGTKKIG